MRSGQQGEPGKTNGKRRKGLPLKLSWKVLRLLKVRKRMLLPQKQVRGKRPLRQLRKCSTMKEGGRRSVSKGGLDNNV